MATPSAPRRRPSIRERLPDLAFEIPVADSRENPRAAVRRRHLRAREHLANLESSLLESYAQVLAILGEDAGRQGRASARRPAMAA